MPAINEIFDGRYQLISNLGIGGFAEVWKARDIQTGLSVALKIFHKQNAEGIELCKEEFLKTYELEHKHILKPKHFNVVDSRPYMIMKFISGCTIQEKLHSLNQLEVNKIITQIGDALSYIHQKNIIHGDIKPNNILVSEDGEYLLSDFGISQKLIHNFTQTLGIDESDQNSFSGVTPIGYRPPELIKYRNWESIGQTAKSDIWSMGMLLYYLTTKELAFNGEGGLGQLMMLKSGKLSLEEALNIDQFRDSPECKELIKKCLALNPKDRPDIISLKYYEPPFVNKPKIETFKALETQNLSLLINKLTSKEKRIILLILVGFLILAFLFYFIQRKNNQNQDKILDIQNENVELRDTFDDIFNEQGLSEDENEVQEDDFEIDITSTPDLSNRSVSIPKINKRKDGTLGTNQAHLDEPDTKLEKIEKENMNYSDNSNEVYDKTRDEDLKVEVDKTNLPNKAKITYNLVAKLRLKNDLLLGVEYKKNDSVFFIMDEDLMSQNIAIIKKGMVISGKIVKADKNIIELEIPKLYSSGGTPIKTLLPKIYFRKNSNGFYAEKGTLVEIKTNEFKDVDVLIQN